MPEKTSKYVLNLNNVISDHGGGDLIDQRKIWKKIGSRVYTSPSFNITDKKNFKPTPINVKINTTKISKFFDLIEASESGEEAPLEQWKKYAKLNITATATGNIPDENLNQLFNDLFVIANICVEGAMDNSSIDFSPKTHPNPASMLCYTITDAWESSRQWGWPALKTLDFDEAWDWYEKIGLLGTTKATTPIQKAIFSLQALSKSDEDFSNSHWRLVSVVQCLESILKIPGVRVATIMNERIHSILGTPPTDHKWLNEAYSIRSKIVHGDELYLRPGYMGDDALNYGFAPNKNFNRCVSVLIAIIQDMITNKTTEYLFETKLIRKPLA